jgi:hypothetical protein
MLMHLPIIVAATLYATPVADSVPKFDIVHECQAEANTQETQQHCVESEKQAFEQVQKEWTSFDAPSRGRCSQEASMGGAGSYAELLTCLEMERDEQRYEEDARKSGK